MLEAAALVHLKHEGADLVKLALLLINHSNHVHGLRGHVVKSAQVHVLETHVDEVTELLGILKVSIINKFHQQEIIEEKLSLWIHHDLRGTEAGAVKLGLSILSDRGRVHWELKSLEQVWQVVREDQHNVRESESLPELLQLFG
jgi:hypothetical protein